MTHLGRARRFILAFSLFLAGCAQLKQCAYEGVSRDQWQQPDRVLASLQIQPGVTVADLGAGSGYFTFKLAEAVGLGGKVYAVDIDSDMISIIRETAKKKGIGNIEPILARSDDPRLPKSSIDLIFTSNTYHHIENRIAYFAKLRQTLRPGGRLAIIELDGRSWIEGALSHSTPKEAIRQEMEQAGYALERDFPFLDRQSFLLFTPRT